MDNKQSTSKLVHPSRNFSASNSGHSPDLRSDMPLTGDQITRAVAQPRRLLPDDVLALQRTIGNQAVLQLLQRQTSTPPYRPAALQPLGVQPKLTVGPARTPMRLKRTKLPINSRACRRRYPLSKRIVKRIRRSNRRLPFSGFSATHRLGWKVGQ